MPIESRFASTEEAEMLVEAIHSRDVSRVREIYFELGQPVVVVWGDVVRALSHKDKKFFQECTWGKVRQSWINKMTAYFD